MIRVSNTLLAIINCIFLVLGLVSVGLGLYFFAVADGQTSCQKSLVNPLMITGAALFVVSLLGLIGSCFRNYFFLIVYLVLMFLLILGLLMLSLFGILVTNEASGKALSNAKIPYFHGWLRKHFVDDSEKWKEIKTCLIDAHVCKSPGGDNGELDQRTATFYNQNLSPIQSGCCQPPKSCGFVHRNATFWLRPEKGSQAVRDDKDCTRWSNQQQTLCYNCESCKEGFIEGIRKKWKQLAIVNAAFTVIAIIVYSVGCCASNSNKEDKSNYNSRYRY